MRGEHKKSGLTSDEALTRVLEQLEQNGQVLRNPYNICVNLVCSGFSWVKNRRRYDTKRKKWSCKKVGDS